MARAARFLLAVFIAVAGLCFAGRSGEAQTRRAFVVGVNNYKGSLKLTLPNQDAADIGKTLSEISFDPKNVEVVADPLNREAFLARLNKFLETVQKGDIVFFYFSGHGAGGNDPNGQRQNYLLFPDVKSEAEFAQTELSEADKRDPDKRKVLVSSDEFQRAYFAKEVIPHSITEKEILGLINQKLPQVAIVVIDACRSAAPPAKGAVRVRAGPGTTLKADSSVPEGFIVLYSASHEQISIEKLRGNDKQRNSLFTEVFRDLVVTPGIDIIKIARRVRDRVSLIARDHGENQDPEYIDNIRNADFYFIEPASQQIKPSLDPCEDAARHLRPLRQRPTREGLDEHLRVFAQCPTVEEAKKLRDQLAHGTFDKTERLTAVASARINPCDRLAASEEDRARPPEVPGVRFDRIDPEQAVPACVKAVTENPRVTRYLFNLARAYQQQAIQLASNTTARQEAERNAVFRYQDVVDRGYVAAFNNLAIMYDNGEGVKADPLKATSLLRLGAEQSHPLAMYNLALRYKLGKGGLTRSSERAYELMAKAAEAGNVDAMVEVGRALRKGYGVDPNPKRAKQWLERAANAGSSEAKRELGLLYLFGGSQFPKDDTQALLWFAQAAEAGDAMAQYIMAQMLANGWGIASPQPQIAERYWRLAAYNGVVDAQIEFAERLLSSRILTRPENSADEAVQLLKLAMRLGSSRAALRLAKVYRTGEFGFPKRPKDAVGYAFEAIDLASQSNTSTNLASFSDHPLDEVAAGILLVEMAANGEAVDADGEPLLKPAMVDRLQYFYGRPDPETKRVKVRSLKVEMKCGAAITNKFIWVWDWGREESPTEAQFRYYENQNPACRPTADSNLGGPRGSTREMLNALWQTVRKDGKISFADIVFARSQQTSSPANDEPEEEPTRRRRRRR